MIALISMLEVLLFLCQYESMMQNGRINVLVGIFIIELGLYISMMASSNA